ncbi:hypothetical protein [Sediminitomix flava]|uniref:Uncharacterized protein n=1 Tax=Sediminitomix flava TaxID=379075 RepID=A0A315ZH68_SEDFL|nr:hypothetical protein [Sediminitomix flava]PWJ44064.1 hypothetical protein BC781_101414 [Sediminitomix flava]
MLRINNLFIRFIIGLSLIGLYSCDVLEEDLPNSLSDEPIPLPSEWTIGIPFLNGDLRLGEFIDIEETENLTFTEDSTYALELSEEQQIGSFEDFASAMGISSTENLFTIKQFDLGDGISQSNTILSQLSGLPIPIEAYPNIEVIFTNEEMDFEGDLNSPTLSFPVALTLPEPEVGETLPDVSFSNISFNRGELVVEAEVEDLTTPISMSFKNLYDNNAQEYVDVSFNTNFSGFGSGDTYDYKVSFSLDLSGYAIDLWDEEANNGLGAVPENLPTIFVDCDDPYLIQDLRISNDNNAESLSFLFNEETNLDGDEIEEEELELDLDNELFDTGSIEFNSANEDFLTAITLQNRLGLNFNISPTINAVFEDEMGLTTTETIELTDENGNDITSGGLNVSTEAASTSIMIKDPASLFSVTPSKKLVALSYGGSINFSFAQGEQITVTSDISLGSQFDVFLPFDVKINGLELAIESDGGIDDIGYDLGTNSQGVLTIFGENELPFGIDIQIRVQTSSFQWETIPSDGGFLSIPVGTISAENPVSEEINYEELRSLTDNQSLEIIIRANSENYEKLNASDKLNIKAGILATLELESSED